MQQLPFPLDWIQSNLLEPKLTIRFSIGELLFFSIAGFLCYRNFRVLKNTERLRSQLKNDRFEVKKELKSNKYTEREFILRQQELFLSEKEQQLKKANFLLSLNPDSEERQVLNKIINDIKDELIKEFFSDQEKKKDKENTK